ncbi:PEP-CTERM sorting domain-containing protein [Phycisphaeraceae bacterium D3-23]
MTAGAADVDLSTGSGGDYAELVVHFSDDAHVSFGVTFDAAAAQWSGEDLVLFVADATGGRALDGSDASFVPPSDFGDFAALDVVFKTFAFGSFFDGFGYGTSSDLGYAGGEDYWHFWSGTTTANTPTGWTVPDIGASDVAVADGSAVGFRYGSAAAPLAVPEPGTAALLVGGVWWVGRRRRTRG